MKKISLALALCCASFYSMADQLSLGGFSYGPMEAPTGKEWESPENLALNKEQPHAYIFPFQDVESARKVLYNPQNQKSRFQKRKIKKNGKRFVDSLYSLIDLKTI